MILVCVLIVIVIYLMLQRDRGKSVNPIKYGKKEHKSNCMVLIVSTILFLPFVVTLCLSFFTDLGNESMENINSLASILLSISFCSGLLFLVACIKTIESYLYLKQLEKNGYIIPDSRKDYEGSLKSLPKVQGAPADDNTKKDCTVGRDKATLVLSFLSAAVTVGFTVRSVYFIKKWSFLGSELAFDLICIGVCVLFFLISSIVFFVQSSNEKYKHPVVSDDSRKNRFSFSGGISFIIIFGIVAVIGFVVLDTITKFIAVSRGLM